MDENNMEMKRIQDEIDKDLQALRQPMETAEAQPAEATEAVASAEPVAETVAQVEEAQSLPIPNIVVQEKEPRAKERGWGFKRVVAVVCIGAVIGGTAIGGGFGLTYSLFTANANQNNVQPTQPPAQFTFNDSQQQLPVTDNAMQTLPPSSATNEAADIVAKIEPSVVNITTLVEAPPQDFFNTGGSGEGQGSGIIFHEDDTKVYIATNNHVVTGATEVTVSVEGKEPVPAKSVGSNPTSDLAVISIEKADLAKAGINRVNVAAFGDSDQLRVGETVLAIGNALGEGNTVSRGIISAKNKTVNVEGTTLDVIQTDAAINPGNSGGPLVNMQGEIIGINTAKFSSASGAIESMGYSLPSNAVKTIVEELMNRPNQAFLGITGSTLTDEMAMQYNLPPMGVLVISVEPGSGADQAGVQRTDIITGFNGSPVVTMEQLSESVKECPIGQEVEIKLLRNGQEPITLTAVLGTNSGTNF